MTFFSYIFSLGSDNQWFKKSDSQNDPCFKSSMLCLGSENQGFKIGFKMMQVSIILSLDSENQG